MGTEGMAGDAFSLPSQKASLLHLQDNYATDIFSALQQAGYKHGEEAVFETYVQSFVYLFKVSETFPKLYEDRFHHLSRGVVTS